MSRVRTLTMLTGMLLQPEDLDYEKEGTSSGVIGERKNEFEYIWLASSDS